MKYPWLDHIDSLLQRRSPPTKILTVYRSSTLRLSKELLHTKTWKNSAYFHQPRVMRKVQEDKGMENALPADRKLSAPDYLMETEGRLGNPSAGIPLRFYCAKVWPALVVVRFGGILGLRTPGPRLRADSNVFGRARDEDILGGKSLMCGERTH
ncbi:hypothetical protein EVAR_16553_1 [Eumeta japonica]|uniref:Uncharacterized protein n=1 Tax=Eumeta variegata TaxID=151549 RepID=A0A4C1U341_EUMVA|nr:hypothetical protein EVAR_16553_1 [Eumeta japonica]